MTAAKHVKIGDRTKEISVSLRALFLLRWLNRNSRVSSCSLIDNSPARRTQTSDDTCSGPASLGGVNSAIPAILDRGLLPVPARSNNPQPIPLSDLELPLGQSTPLIITNCVSPRHKHHPNNTKSACQTHPICKYIPIHAARACACEGQRMYKNPLPAPSSSSLFLQPKSPPFAFPKPFLRDLPLL